MKKGFNIDNTVVSVQGFIETFKDFKFYCLKRIGDLDITSKHYYENKARLEGSIHAYDFILMMFENLRANDIDFDLSKFNERGSNNEK